MRPRKVREISTALLAKGFHMCNSHHQFYWLFVNGKKTSVRTRLSHGATEYSEDLLAQVAKQLHLTVSELEKFLDCPLTYEEYVMKLRERGHVRVA